MPTKSVLPHADVVMIGAGIMSAHLAAFLKELEPDRQIQIFERLDAAGLESSNTLNNAGTGHSALCELNYTPETTDGDIDITKAIKIMEQFERSKQFWAYLTEQGYFSSRYNFINAVPHMSIVYGKENVRYLRKRWEALTQHHLFTGMEYTEDHTLLHQWFPLMMKVRQPDERIAATRAEIGTEINFGLLTQGIFQHLDGHDQVSLHFHHEVVNFSQHNDGTRSVKVRDLNAVSEGSKTVRTKFIFIGSGGSAITLLQKTGIAEAKQFAGFPVDGQRFVCNNPEVIAQHHGKVYGKPEVGAPPMSTPHLDTRYVNGKKTLIFGPFAGFTTKFLKKGSIRDLFKSVKWHNIIPMFQVSIRNFTLTKYLFRQVFQKEKDRLETLREFIPDARAEDWVCELAGKRVQIIKNIPERGGVLQFGTEVVVSSDRTVSALLGASPGASTSVHIMLELLQKAFPEKYASSERKEKLDKMVMSHDLNLHDHPIFAYQVRAWTHDVLQLTMPVAPAGIALPQTPGIRKPAVEKVLERG